MHDERDHEPGHDHGHNHDHHNHGPASFGAAFAEPDGAGEDCVLALEEVV